MLLKIGHGRRQYRYALEQHCLISDLLMHSAPISAHVTRGRKAWWPPQSQSQIKWGKLNYLCPDNSWHRLRSMTYPLLPKHKLRQKLKRPKPDDRRVGAKKMRLTAAHLQFFVGQSLQYHGLKYAMVAGSLPQAAARNLPLSFAIVPSATMAEIILSIVALLGLPFG